MLKPKREKREKVKLTKDSYQKAKRIFTYIKPYSVTFGIGWVFLVLSSSVGLLFPYLMGQLLGAPGIMGQDVEPSDSLIDLSNINTIALALFLPVNGLALFKTNAWRLELLRGLSLLGVTFGLLSQLVLYDWSGLLLLVAPMLWLGAMLFSHAHVKEASGSGVGFGALTTLGILFGQYLTPGNDLVFSALYRVSSILFAIVATLLACYLIHRLLNRFEATRFGY